MKHTQKRVGVAMLFAAWLAIFGVSAAAGTPATTPNIIFILADDMGYGDLGCYGQTKIKTPSLDKMAAEGMRFTDHYSGQTVCSPSRCSLMTGLHMGHASVKSNGPLLNPEDVTVAELLKQAGYATCAVGKWGLSQGALSPSSPNQKGFDHWFGFDNQGFAHFYYPDFLWRNHTRVDYPENMGIRDEQGAYPEGKGTYCHDEFTKEALSFIETNRNQPFFLYLPYSVPHAEMTVPEDSKAPYRLLGWPETAKPEGGGARKGKGFGSQYGNGYCAQKEPNVTYAAMISRMDRDVGRIFDLLKTLGIDENTIVLFASDNGPSDEGGQSLEFFQSHGVLRGHKQDIYEGGIRIPFIVRWPGNVQRGTVCDLPCAFWDFLPTACEIAGVNAPENVDGISLLPALLGRPDQQKMHKYLYWQWKNLEAVRVGKWKFFYMNATRPDEAPVYELYNLETDLSEQNNVAASHPELIQSFLPYLKEAQIPATHEGKKGL